MVGFHPFSLLNFPESGICSCFDCKRGLKQLRYESTSSWDMKVLANLSFHLNFDQCTCLDMLFVRFGAVSDSKTWWCHHVDHHPRLGIVKHVRNGSRDPSMQGIKVFGSARNSVFSQTGNELNSPPMHSHFKSTRL
jgi:hypothetical protein